jgi:hypothetical protein
MSTHYARRGALGNSKLRAQIQLQLPRPVKLPTKACARCVVLVQSVLGLWKYTGLLSGIYIVVMSTQMSSSASAQQLFLVSSVSSLSLTSWSFSVKLSIT